MTKKEKFNNGINNIKSGINGAINGALATTVAISVLGALAHIGPMLGDTNLSSDYSLKHRFETAYSFNTPEKHKYYHATPVINGYYGETEKERYLASPFATYGAIAMGAAVGAAAFIADEKRKQKQR